MSNEPEMTREQLKKATADLSDKLIGVVYEEKQQFVVSMTALLTSTIGYATTALAAIQDPQAREQVSVHIGGMLLKSVETVLEAGGVSDSAEDKTSR